MLYAEHNNFGIIFYKNNWHFCIAKRIQAKYVDIINSDRYSRMFVYGILARSLLFVRHCSPDLHLID